MLAYILRRLLLMIPVIFGVLLLTFVLFAIAAPDPAQAYAGRHRSQAELTAIRHQMGLDKPLWLNFPAARHSGHWTEIFNSQFCDVLFFRPGDSMSYREPVWELFKRKAPISFSIQFPIFIILIGVQLALALIAARHRNQPIDWTITASAVALMSIPGLSLYLVAQSIFGGQLHWFPIAGWTSGIAAIHFMALPILISIFVGWGGSARFYRTVVLEEMNQDYIRTAKAKGATPREVLFTHTMANIMIQVITRTITALPGLFLGALLLERIFQIPGIGGLLVDAINSQDRAIIMFTTYITAVAYAFMLLINDILYTMVDPRVSLR